MRKKNIVLLGFMGTGKSSVGRNLAKELGWEFIDTDVEIEKLTDLKVTEIFRKFGETRFRSEEALLLKRLREKEQCVIATGGGTMLNPDNWRTLAEISVTIALYASLEEIYRRIGNRNDRPLLRGDVEEIKALWERRQPIYNQAECLIDTTDKDIRAVVEEILEIVKGGNSHGAET